MILLASPQHSAATSLERLYAPRSVEFEPVTEAAQSIDGVFGVDERVQVTVTNVPPGSMTVFLMIQWATGETGGCSGFMIGSRTVGTAGHCIYSHSSGGWPLRVLAVPGANGSERPFGESWAVSAHTVAGWTDVRDGRFDFGAVTLADDIGLASGAFSLTVAPDEVLLSTELGTTGYSGDKPPATMWRSSGHLDSVDEFLLYSKIDVTYGHSGGPLWFRTAADEYYVVGIVSAGSDFTNMAVRVSTEVFQHLVSWVELLPGTPAGEPIPHPPSVAPPPVGTITTSPSSVSGAQGELAMAVVAVGAQNGQGDLTVTTLGGALIANAFLTPASCGGGTTRCAGVPEVWSTSVTVADPVNDLRSVLLTLGGTISGSTSVVITAQQGGQTWSTELEVTLLGSDGSAPFTAYGTGITAGRTIEALIEGVVCGSTTADADGNWILLVRSTDPCAPAPGATLRFRLDGQATTATEVWMPGGAPADVENGITLELLLLPPPPTGAGTFDRPVTDVGINTAVWNGGTVAQLAAATVAAGGTTVAVFVGGQATVLIPGAPDFINLAFNAAYPTGDIPAGTIVFVAVVQ